MMKVFEKSRKGSEEMSKHVVWKYLDIDQFTDNGVKVIEKMYDDVLRLVRGSPTDTVSENCDILLNITKSMSLVWDFQDVLKAIKEEDSETP